MKHSVTFLSVISVLLLVFGNLLLKSIFYCSENWMDNFPLYAYNAYISEQAS